MWNGFCPLVSNEPMLTLVTFAALLATQFPVVPPPPPPPPLFPPVAIINGVESEGAPVPQDGEGTVRGVVRRADTGAGIRDVAIRLSTRPTTAAPPMSLSMLTDDAGRFEFSKLPFGFYDVSAAREGYFAPSPNDIPVTVGMSAVTLDALHKSVVLTTDLFPSGIIAGSVQDTRGMPVPNIPVTALRTSYRKGVKALTPLKTLNTDDRGAFRIAGLAPGEYYVRADAPSVAVAGSEAPKIMSFSVRTTASGGVGGNLAATPALFSPTYAPNSLHAVNGVSFRVRGGDELTARIELAQGTPLRISGTVSNTVAAEPGARTPFRETVVGFLLMPRNADLDEGTAGVLLQNVAADQSGGKFEIVTTRPGLYDLVAVVTTLYQRQIGGRTTNALGFKGGKTLIDLRDRDITDTHIEISSGGDLEVGFRTPAGAAVQQVGYLLRSRDATDTTPLIEDTGAIVNPDGRTSVSIAMTPNRTFVHLPEGEYQFEFPIKPAGTYISEMKQGGRSVYPNGVVSVGKSSAEPVEVIFSPGGATVSGKIAGEVSATRPARITLVPQGARQNNPMFYVRATSRDGTFSLSGIAPGQYKLFAFDSLPPSADENAAFLEPYQSSGRALVLDVNSSVSNLELPLLRPGR
jgi:hypothetical protein